ncbi:MAG: murein biosynthesis integral membrane protein MurJ [Chloroflexi bacterium]|nr:murein biosynthesis integral membrane protein MurJ [Chloroflexota bacterium]
MNTPSATTTRHLVTSTSIVMFFFVISKAMGLVREIVIAAQFGTSAQLDAYIAAFRVPDLLFNLVAGGALASALIPPFTKLLTQGDLRGGWRLAAQVINLVFVIVAALCIVAALFAEPIVRLTVGVGFTLDQQILTASLMRLMLVTPAVFAVSGIVMGILNAQHEFLLPAAAPAMYNLAIIGGALLLAPTLGVYGLAVGVVVGAFLHLLIQAPWLIRYGKRARIEYTASLGIYDAGVREVVRLVLPRTVGIAAVQLNFLVNTILASTLATGSLAALNYAFLLVLLPIGVIAQSIATVLFPMFARMFAVNDMDGLRRAFSTGFRVTLFLTMPATIGLMLLARPIIQLVLEHGAFTAESTEMTLTALELFAVGLFAHAGLETITRAFYAMHDTATPVRIGVASVVLNVILSLVLIGPLKQGGLALANSIATILEMFVLLYLLRPRLQGIDGRTLARSALKMLIGAAAMVGAIELLRRMPLAQDAWFLLGGGIVVGGGAYFLTMLVLRSDEIRLALSLARRRGKQ